jgi:hypothetical protein
MISALFFFSTFGIAHYLLPKRSFAAFYLLAATLFGLALGRGIPEAYRLKNNGALVEGTISTVDCGNHGRIYFDYVVTGRQFSGSENASAGGIDCQNVKVGMLIPVYYDTANPQNAIAGNATANANEQLFFTLFAMLGFPALIIFLYVRKNPASESS